MINTSAVQPRNERSAAVWNSGGSNYDRISRSIADSLEHCVMRLDPKPGERILDLATGTGWTSRLVARRGATVTGVDIAGSLLDAARENASRENLSISYQLADAEELPSDSAIYEAVVSTYGVMFASRPEAAAAEIARVCRKGGRLAITTWFKEGKGHSQELCAGAVFCSLTRTTDRTASLTPNCFVFGGLKNDSRKEAVPGGPGQCVHVAGVC